MKISDSVANVLANSTVVDNKLFLPDEQLDRKLYVAVNKALTALNGKWNRKAGAHIFNESPTDVIDNILLTGEYTDQKKEYQFFETPIEIAKELVSLAGINGKESVLEPSAGKGRIAGLIKDCHCIELNDENRKYLFDNKFNVVGKNFMEFDNRYDVMVANPPFAKQQDIHHVNRMIDLANRRVVSIMSASVTFRTNRLTVEFRERVKGLDGTIEMLPEKSFSESGTGVAACIVCIDI